MGASSAVQWWEEWQLRVLVLASLVVQYILFITSTMRKFPTRSWIRPFTWLAYLGSDAIAIYDLATLFNRHKKPDGVHGSNLLEVVWAPVLLMHLGGQDGITAYNIEDNELWTRHILTAVSQVTVAVYVFWKSRPGGDRRLLQAAILLFVPGILKCFEKPWALNSASINSLVSSPVPGYVRRTTSKKAKIDPLEVFVGMAKACCAPEANASGNSETETKTKTEIDKETETEAKAEKPAEAMHLEPDKLFVDLASPPSDARLRTLKFFSALDDDKAYFSLREGLHNTFDLLYTKQNMFSDLIDRKNPTKALHDTQELNENSEAATRGSPSLRGFCGGVVRGVGVYLPFAAIGLFHHSHRQAYNHYDVKVTYTIICCTAVLEGLVLGTIDKIKQFIAAAEQIPRETKRNTAEEKQLDRTPEIAEEINIDDMVSQCNLLALFLRDQKYSKMMSIVGKINCREYLHQRWRINSCSSSRDITALVLNYVRGGWNDHIQDVLTYRMFNENRGHCALKQGGCYEDLGWILDGAFDESVLLWHLTTDFCYHYTGPSRHGSKCTKVFDAHVYRCPAWCNESRYYERAVLCREMSNYMMHLLLVNPEMLMAGSRRNLFTAAYEELKDIMDKDIMNKDKKQRLEERELVHRIISMVNGRVSVDPKGSHEGKVDGTASADPEGSHEGKVDGTASADPEGSHEEKVDGTASADPEGSLEGKVDGTASADPEGSHEGNMDGKASADPEGSHEGKVDGTASADPEGSQEENMDGKASADPEGSHEGKVDGTEGSHEAKVDERASADPKGYHEGFIRDAWGIAKVLMGLPEEKMWAVIEGVWVEMLCFSASRCRGYLHAKDLGAGVEYLSYVWLLQYYMGMETLAERLQRVDHHNQEKCSCSISRKQQQAADPSNTQNSSATEEEITVAGQ